MDKFNSEENLIKFDTDDEFDDYGNPIPSKTWDAQLKDDKVLKLEQKMQIEFTKMKSTLRDQSKTIEDVKKTISMNEKTISTLFAKLNREKAEKVEEKWMRESQEEDQRKEMTSMAEKHKQEISGLKDELKKMAEELLRSQRNNQSLRDQLRNQVEANWRLSPNNSLTKIRANRLQEISKKIHFGDDEFILCSQDKTSSKDDVSNPLRKPADGASVGVQAEPIRPLPTKPQMVHSTYGSINNWSEKKLERNELMPVGPYHESPLLITGAIGSRTLAQMSLKGFLIPDGKGLTLRISFWILLELNRKCDVTAGGPFRICVTLVNWRQPKSSLVTTVEADVKKQKTMDIELCRDVEELEALVENDTVYWNVIVKDGEYYKK